MFIIRKLTIWPLALFLLIPLFWVDRAQAGVAGGNADRDGGIVPTFPVPGGSQGTVSSCKQLIGMLTRASSMKRETGSLTTQLSR